MIRYRHTDTGLGTFRNRVTIKKPVPHKDKASGEMKNVWRKAFTVWAEIRAIRGREYFAAQQTIAESTHEITIRYMAGIKPAMRIYSENRIFDIQAVLDKDGVNRHITMVCKEVF